MFCQQTLIGLLYCSSRVAQLFISTQGKLQAGPSVKLGNRISLTPIHRYFVSFTPHLRTFRHASLRSLLSDQMANRSMR
jgi:hypothetical protein